MSAPTGLHGVILAAGAARRFGGGKLVASFDGRPLIHWAVVNALRTPIEACVVVTAPDGAAVREAVDEAGGQDPRLQLVVAEDAHAGLSASLRAGLLALPRPSAGVLIFLGDMPRVDPRHGHAVAAALLDGAPCAEMICRGQPAHPVGVSARLYPEILSLRGDAGARALFDRADGLRLQTEDPGTVLDIDTLADLDRGDPRTTGARP